MLTIDGISSGIDTTTVINGLLELQQKRLDELGTRRTGIQTRQAAFQAFQAQLLSLQSTAGTLSRQQGNPFSKRLVTSSNEDLVTATASSRATPGTYRFHVNALATAQQLATGAFASVDTEITQGTLSLSVGAGESATITVDASNNTLTGLVNAINAAGAGVTASTIRDMSSGSPTYRVLLSANSTGEDQQINLTNNLATASGSAVRPDFSVELQAAGNAQIALGSGTNAITIENGTNQFTELVPGVTINLLGAAPGEEVVLNVARDTESAVMAVKDFVNAYNDVLDFIETQSRFDPETNQAGLLQGNRSLQGIQNRLQNAVLSTVAGIDKSANRLTALGVSVNDTGRLILDESRLTSVAAGEAPGIALEDLTRLFSLTGESSNPGLRFVSGSSRTLASTAAYGIDVTQAARQATLTGSATLAASTVINGTNNELLLSLDGASATLSLKHGTYSAAELVSLLQNSVNASTDLPGRRISAALNGNSLTLTSASYGTQSRLSIDGGSALAALGLTVGQNATGVDVAGTFLVDGVSESAIGQGRQLTGVSSNSHTADLQVEINLADSAIGGNPDGEITVTRGIAARLNDVLSEILDPVRGDLAIVDDGFDRDLEGIDATVERQTEIFDQKKDSLIAQFTQLESALSQIQSIGNLLSTQLSSLSLRRS